jgi:SAM-dependent methyltransferase
VTRHASGDATWSGEGYAGWSSHHRSFDEAFLARYPLRPQERVVDAGCGSGEFTVRLAGLVPDGRVLGVDPDPSMLGAARRHAAANLEFRQGRLQELGQVCEPSWADLVVSRAVLHWIPLADHADCYEQIRRVLRPGGWFHAEWGGAGNLRHLRTVLDELARGLDLEPATVAFPDAGVVFDGLEQAGFDIAGEGVTTVAQRRGFTWEQLLGFVRTQASVAYGLTVSDDRFDRFVAAVDRRRAELRRHDGSYDQTFVRIHVRCRRPPSSG